MKQAPEVLSDGDAAMLITETMAAHCGLDMWHQAIEIHKALLHHYRPQCTGCAVAEGAHKPADALHQTQEPAADLTNEQIDSVFERMPGGAQSFLKTWGYQQFARAIQGLRSMPTWEPAFDAMEPEQEKLAIHFCAVIAGPIGKKGSPPDPVRLLEMAQALYNSEREGVSCRQATRHQQ